MRSTKAKTVAGGYAARNGVRMLPSTSQASFTRRGAFTLIEILLASVAAAMILVVINAIFVRAIHLRDSATTRVRDTRLRARAERAIRDDLQSALVSGGVLAASLEGGSTSTGGPGGASFPGYLKLTTTNGRSTSGSVGSDVQQVEYYITNDPNTAASGDAPGGGVLVRAITRDLLATTPTVSRQETILTGVQSLQVQFYDGTNWQDSWEFTSSTAAAQASSSGTTSTSTSGTSLTTGNTTLPQAVRVDVRQVAARNGEAAPLLLEVLVPWTAQPFVGATPVPSSGGGLLTPTPDPNPDHSGGPPPGGRPPGGGNPPPGGPTGGRPPSR